MQTKKKKKGEEKLFNILGKIFLEIIWSYGLARAIKLLKVLTE